MSTPSHPSLFECRDVCVVPDAPTRQQAHARQRPPERRQQFVVHAGTASHPTDIEQDHRARAGVDGRSRQLRRLPASLVEQSRSRQWHVVPEVEAESDTSRDGRLLRGRRTTAASRGPPRPRRSRHAAVRAWRASARRHRAAAARRIRRPTEDAGAARVGADRRRWHRGPPRSTAITPAQLAVGAGECQGIPVGTGHQHRPDGCVA